MHSSKPPSASATHISVTTCSTESVVQTSPVSIAHNQPSIRDAISALPSTSAQTVVDNSITKVQPIRSESVLSTICPLTKTTPQSVFGPPSFSPTVNEPPALCAQPVKLAASLNFFQQALNQPSIRPAAHDGIVLFAKLTGFITVFPLAVYVFWRKSYV